MSVPRALDRARVVIGKTFTATAVVTRRVQVADSSGGFTDTYPVFAAYPCSFAEMPIRPREVEQGQRVQLVSLWQFVFPASAIIQATDRLLVGTRTFEVVDTGLSSLAVALRIICSEIT